jgi:citrate lyase subunit beta/citryl-CoA lyase
MRVHPRRSALYVPGHQAAALARATALPADVLIYDLEEAVPPGAKVRAREQVARALGHRAEGGHEVVVRINALSTTWALADIAALARLPIDAILLPKVESPEPVHRAVEALASGGARDMRLWAMIESPRAMFHIHKITTAHRRLAAIVLGTRGLTKDIKQREELDRAPLIAMLTLCIFAARSHGLDALDGIHPDLSDMGGLRRACEQGRELGFHGKTLIHPSQIAIANAVFGPSDADVAQARAVVEAWDEVHSASDTEESMHVQAAQRTLALASALRDLAAGHH